MRADWRICSRRGRWDEVLGVWWSCLRFWGRSSKCSRLPESLRAFGGVER